MSSNHFDMQMTYQDYEKMWRKGQMPLWRWKLIVAYFKAKALSK